MKIYQLSKLQGKLWWTGTHDFPGIGWDGTSEDSDYLYVTSRKVAETLSGTEY